MAHIQTLSSSIYSYLDALSFDGVENTLPSRRAATAGVSLTAAHFTNGGTNFIASAAAGTVNNRGFELSLNSVGTTPVNTYVTGTTAGVPVIAGADDATIDPGDIARMPSIREFPSIGTPANIVNVPVFGQATSAQVQGQADAPNMEITVNYIAREMVKFHAAVEAGTDFAFRFMMVDGPLSLTDSINTQLVATAGGTNPTTANTPGARQLLQGVYENNTHFYFEGRVEAVLVNPALTDATTAQITLTAKTAFVGPDTTPREV